MEYLIKNKFAALLLLLLVSANGIFAQTNRKLSLQEAIQLSIDNSKALKVSYAKVEQADGAVTEAKMMQYPDLKVSASYMRFNSPNVDVKLNTGKSDTSGGGLGSGNFNQVMYGMATASVPLFSGLRIRNAIASQQYLKKAAELDAKNDKDALIQNTIAAYYNLYKAQAAVKLVNENLKEEQQRVTDFTNLETNGLVARNDLLKVQLQESNYELALVDAENNLKISNYNMNLMLGIDENTVLELDVADIGRMPKIQPIEYWENNAMTNRADFLALQQRQNASSAGVKSAKGEYYPTVALSGGYIAANIPNALVITNALNVGVGLSYNLASLYKNESKVKQAKAQQTQLQWSALEMTDGIKMEIHSAYQNYLESLKKIEVYQKAVDQASENYRITKNKYDNALATTTDLLDADVAQLRAGIDFEYAKADAQVAYNKLYETAGLISSTIPETK